MNKQLKFNPTLVPLVLSGEKTSTWRLWDDKNLSEGDRVDFVDSGNGRVFVTSRLIKIIEKSLGEMTAEDKEGHERFSNDQEMYETYSKYYNRPVDRKTIVKLIWFELLPIYS